MGRPVGPLGIDPLMFSIVMFSLLLLFVFYLMLPRAIRKQYFGAYPKRHAWSARSRTGRRSVATNSYGPAQVCKPRCTMLLLLSQYLPLCKYISCQSIVSCSKVLGHRLLHGGIVSRTLSGTSPLDGRHYHGYQYVSARWQSIANAISSTATSTSFDWFG